MKVDKPETVQQYLKELKKTFYTRKTQKLEWRKKQLSQIVLGFKELESKMAAALKKDLGREEFCSFFQETSSPIAKANDDISMLDQYVKDDKRDTPLTIAPAKSRVIFQPLGAVCIMSAWNFPFITLFLPLISAIAAGNCALLKPSEMSPHCSAVCRELVETYLDNDCIKIVEGGAEISITCSQLKWDKICFTGSSEKGKLVAQAAAKNLVPCLLELGGKSVSIVDESSDASFAALKIASSRAANCGQICISPDYVFVHESKKKEFLETAVKTFKECHGEDPQKDEFYPRMVNEFHTERVLKMIKGHGGKIILGGEGDIKDKYIAPTIIDEPSMDSDVMKEEIFGPVLPVVSFKDIQEVIDHMNNNEKPLAMYYFGGVNGENKTIFEREIQSGMMAVNDCLIQAFNPKLPFGGIGYSGQGSYTGIDGFKNFSNSKAVVVKPQINIDSMNRLIMPPYSNMDKATLKFLISKPLYQGQVQKFLMLLLLLIVVLAYFYAM
ncbi:unnamed protein product [Moneuplotes crassus]|uniref:Aldehyde dehydrogenase n=1 Tax=Euplotes crassus TaxID=5936 RepID=A0A7S3KQY0_EUPCR|nr:unnamed protein product [Moneuplotes crassus]|mmetsp:Transcript_38147/g.37653  ORF Transcript_38147/g.37653 Transcript_38147/m.37653 type:complete len:497 (+) Transcript_38147:32-1522(+)